MIKKTWAVGVTLEHHLVTHVQRVCRKHRIPVGRFFATLVLQALRDSELLKKVIATAEDKQRFADLSSQAVSRMETQVPKLPGKSQHLTLVPGTVEETTSVNLSGKRPSLTLELLPPPPDTAEPPAVPAEPAEPAEPLAVPAEPLAVPAEPPAVPAEPAELSAVPAEPAELPAASVEPAEPAEPPAAPVRSVEPAEPPAAPVRSVEPAEPAEPPAAPVRLAESAEPPAAPVRSAEPPAAKVVASAEQMEEIRRFVELPGNYLVGDILEAQETFRVPRSELSGAWAARGQILKQWRAFRRQLTAELNEQEKAAQQATGRVKRVAELQVRTKRRELEDFDSQIRLADRPLLKLLFKQDDVTG